MAACPFRGSQNDVMWHATGICHITSSVNFRLRVLGDHISWGEINAFLGAFWCFSGREFGILGGEIPPGDCWN